MASHRPFFVRLTAGAIATPRRFFAVAALVTLVVVAADATVRALAPRRPGRAGGAAWIWAEGAQMSGRPVAFLAVGEVRLAEAPAEAELEIGVDEAYVLHLNGQFIGAGAYGPGDPLHRYRVRDVLRRGRNRIVVEARSVRGAGAVLVRLRDGEGKTLARSGPGWRIHRAAPDRLGDRSRPLRGGEAPRLWGHGSIGRWRLSGASVARPRLPRRQRWLRATAARREEPPGDWRPLGRGRRGFPFAGDRYVLYDFGRPVTGFLSLDLDPGVDQPGLLTVSLLAPPARFSPPVEVILPIAGAGRWDDATARTFRYCLVAESGVVAPPRVRPVPPSTAAVLSASRPSRGVFGLPAPPSQVAPLAFAIWERLDAELYAASQEPAEEVEVEATPLPSAEATEPAVKKAGPPRRGRPARDGRRGSGRDGRP